MGAVVSLRAARPHPRMGLGDAMSFPKSCHLVGETHCGSQTLNMEGVPGENAQAGWWGKILEQQKELDGSPTDEDHGPVLHLGNTEHACMTWLLPAHCSPNDFQQLLLRGPCPQVVPQ